MLTIKLQETLDRNWENCWPVSDLRPIALLDLISYLFFIKKADDLEQIQQTIKNSLTEDFIYPPEIETFTWSNFQNQNAKDIHHLFTKEKGLLDIMSHYSKTKAAYSSYFKSSLLIDPTPKLLFNAIEIINIIETNDQPTREKIIEYLFTKSNLSEKTGQLFLPPHIVKLIISLADPAPGDLIFDPAAGNGNLLLSAYKYTLPQNDALISSAISQTKIKLAGCEPDVVHLRIAAMNLNVHGLDESKAAMWLSAPAAGKKSDLIISSLPVSESDENLPGKQAGDFSEREPAILDNILEGLGENSRAVVMVGQNLLQGDEPANLNARKKLAEQNNLEGVITLSSKSDSFYSGSAILIFDKSRASSEKTWFYKWRNAGRKKNKEAQLNDESSNSDFEEVSNILDKWKTRNDSSAFSSANGFFISINYLRSNNYNLSFNDYKLISQQQSENEYDVGTERKESVVAANKENLHEFFEASRPLTAEKRKRRLSPALLVTFILVCAAFAVYWVYSKDTKKYFSKNYVAPRSGDSANKNSETSSIEPPSGKLVSIKNTSGEASENNSETNSKKYTVINKAWFHYEPDSGKIKPLYLTPRKGLVVVSREEKDGFVYVVYVNSNGEATHGWLDKRDLQPVE
jgi:type I restriction enzyme M protein